MDKFKQDSSTKAWNNLGEEWFALAQNGESRMQFIMPYTLEKLGNVAGKKILDLGCGEGQPFATLPNRQKRKIFLYSIIEETAMIFLRWKTILSILCYVL